MSWRRFLSPQPLGPSRERAREVESYLDFETADNIAREITPLEARLAARRRTWKHHPYPGGDLSHEQHRIRRNNRGFSACRSGAGQKSRIYDGGGAVPGAGGRGQYGGVQPGPRGAAALAAVSRARPHRHRGGARHAVSTNLPRSQFWKENANVFPPSRITAAAAKRASYSERRKRPRLCFGWATVSSALSARRSRWGANSMRGERSGPWSAIITDRVW